MFVEPAQTVAVLANMELAVVGTEVPYIVVVEVLVETAGEDIVVGLEPPEIAGEEEHID